MKKDTTKQTKKPECECGCGETTNGGRFKPGHDAKLKSALVTAALDGNKRAETKLETLGWTKFLDAKREKQANKAEAAEAKASEAQGRGRGRRCKSPESSEAGPTVEKPRRRGGRREKAEAAAEPTGQPS